MLHRLAILTLVSFTLATCQTQKVEKTSTDTPSTTNMSTPKVSTVSSPSETLPPNSTPNTGEPMKDTGLEVLENPKNVVSENKSYPQKKIIYLKEGENTFLKEEQMNLTFKRVIEDSRCPDGVNCIWAGVATAEVELMGVATRPIKLNFSTMDNQGKGYLQTQTFNGYKITILSLTPKPTKKKGYEKNKGIYKIGLQIEKADPLKSQKSVTTK